MSDDVDEYAVLDEFEQSQGQQHQQADASNKRRYDDGQGEQYMSAPLCPCGGGQCLIEKDREGRAFFVCPEEEGAQCSFRRAVDAMKQSRTSAATSMGPGHPAAAAPYAFTPTDGPVNGYGQQQQQHYGQHTPGQQQQQQSYGGGAQDEGTQAPPCLCGDPAVLRTSNSARNPGRQFYGCAKMQNDPARCRFFKWLDELGAGNNPATAAFGGSSQYNTSYSQQQSQQQQGQYGAAAAGDAPPCKCGEPSAMRTSNSARNPGRQFYGCGKPMNDTSRCNFFAWVDAAGQAAAGPGGGYGSSAAGGGGWYGSMPAAGAAGGGGGSSGDVVCVCGQPALSRVSNSEKNPGRQYYKCPKPPGEACNWFKWADEVSAGGAAGPAYASQQGGSAAAPAAAVGYGFGGQATSYGSGGGSGDGLNGLNVAGPASNEPVGSARFAWEDASRPQPGAAAAAGGAYGAGSSYGGGGGTSSSTDTCYKCGQTGHWSRDCPNAGTAGRGGGGTGGGGAGGGGVCYKCNQPGHWARDCPNAGAGGSSYGGGYAGGRSSYGGGGGGAKGGVCYKCNQPGHWSSSCPNQ